MRCLVRDSCSMPACNPRCGAVAADDEDAGKLRHARERAQRRVHHREGEQASAPGAENASKTLLGMPGVLHWDHRPDWPLQLHAAALRVRFLALASTSCASLTSSWSVRMSVRVVVTTTSSSAAQDASASSTT